MSNWLQHWRSSPRHAVPCIVDIYWHVLMKRFKMLGCVFLTWLEATARETGGRTLYELISTFWLPSIAALFPCCPPWEYMHHSTRSSPLPLRFISLPPLRRGWNGDVSAAAETAELLFWSPSYLAARLRSQQSELKQWSVWRGKAKLHEVS